MRPGEPIYASSRRAPQEGVLYLGIAGEEISAGAFENEAVNLNLVAVVTDQGMCSSMRRMPLVVRPSITTSRMGLDPRIYSPVSVGGHASELHFPQQAATRLSFKPTVCRQAAGQAVSSEAVSFIFEVLELEIFAQGELDMEVVYEDGEWELALLDEQ